MSRAAGCVVCECLLSLCVKTNNNTLPIMTCFSVFLCGRGDAHLTESTDIIDCVLAIKRLCSQIDVA